ncbi:MAG: hypothetical protein L6R42_007204 [Xanthoria sp. 1 TBL-2021]|nr:MAG: hypothetical protein L6R42_007204 [Xanthoria sp. 1 TBL-2021]
MLFSTSSICFAAALLLTPSLAGPIAFGNPTFNTVRFGVPFPIQWYGGDGTPVTIILNSGNPAALQPVGSVASESLHQRSPLGSSSHNLSSAGLLSSPYTWTPVASNVVRPGVSYVLSIVQSGLTNYSPVFSIGARAAGPQLAHAVRAPLPIGTAGYYPLQKPTVQDDPAIYPRDDATGGIHRRHAATGIIVPQHGPTGVAPSSSTERAITCAAQYPNGIVCSGYDADGYWVSEQFGSGVHLSEATPEAWSTAVAADPFASATHTPIYSTGTGTPSLPAYPTGGRYNNVTATGTVGRAAAHEIAPTASSIAQLCDQVAHYGYKLDGCSNGAQAIGADVRAITAEQMITRCGMETYEQNTHEI